MSIVRDRLLAGHRPHPSSHLALSLARLATVVAVIAAIGYVLGLMAPRSLFWVIGAAILMVLAAFAAGCVAIAAIWNDGREGTAELGIALLWSLPLLALMGVGSALILTNPPLNEVSTDPAEPPRFVANRDEPLPIERLRAQILAWPNLTGRRYSSALQELEIALREVLSDNGWQVYGQIGSLEREGELTLLARGRGGPLLLPTRLAIRITEEGETSYVDIRSRSLAGTHDFGGNEQIISGLYGALGEALAPVTDG